MKTTNERLNYLFSLENISLDLPANCAARAADLCKIIQTVFQRLANTDNPKEVSACCTDLLLHPEVIKPLTHDLILYFFTKPEGKLLTVQLQNGASIAVVHIIMEGCKGFDTNKMQLRKTLSAPPTESDDLLLKDFKAKYKTYFCRIEQQIQLAFEAAQLHPTSSFITLEELTENLLLSIDEVFDKFSLAPSFYKILIEDNPHLTIEPGSLNIFPISLRLLYIDPQDFRIAYTRLHQDNRYCIIPMEPQDSDAIAELASMLLDESVCNTSFNYQDLCKDNLSLLALDRTTNYALAYLLATKERENGRLQLSIHSIGIRSEFVEEILPSMLAELFRCIKLQHKDIQIIKIFNHTNESPLALSIYKKHGFVQQSPAFMARNLIPNPLHKLSFHKNKPAIAIDPDVLLASLKI